MKVPNTQWRLIALIPLVTIAILSIGNRIGAVPDQKREMREAAISPLFSGRSAARTPDSLPLVGRTETFKVDSPAPTPTPPGGSCLSGSDIGAPPKSINVWPLTS